jgi:hypothetical protein
MNNEILESLVEYERHKIANRKKYNDNNERIFEIQDILKKIDPCFGSVSTLGCLFNGLTLCDTWTVDKIKRSIDLVKEIEDLESDKSSSFQELIKKWKEVEDKLAKFYPSYQNWIDQKKRDFENSKKK